ncbi:MAG TPA: FAD-dependent oxidoreductase [Phycisphaerales bacterium]|nr:FAD-dependent oxidoreductase [Phycisphaerales bacterium]HCD34023.1 FAD-dependent oxidoreductase [Phycisphaerales bacterium]|tara:strand:- start:97958 stop:99313 length:1356 start_codon:yes stop_codon:yes gene_type:complete
MAQYTFKPRELDMDDSWDVIVVGGGPAGCTAAASAAREGARTLLIEATGILGGMGTSALVPAWCPFTDKQKIIYRGMGETILKKCIAGMPHVAEDQFNWTPIDAEQLKRIYDDLVTDAGVTVMFHSVLSAVDVDDQGNVQAIIISSKAGLTAYKAKVYVDCSGDADLAAWAGAEFQKGDEQTGEMQPGTHCFLLTNVDMYHHNHGPWLHGSNQNSPVHKMAADPEFDLIIDAHACNNIVGPGTIGFNAGHVWGVDNTDPFSLSKGLMQGRRFADQFQRALVKHHPKAYAGSFLVSTGSLLGIRETRRIIGDYILTRDDYIARRSFPDEIARNSYYLDVHLSKSEKDMAEPELDKRCARYEPGESHGIPYRCLTPKGLKNVLIAGRCISADRAVQGSTRVMPVCLVMGEAAGLAAAMAGQAQSIDTHAIDTNDLRSRLQAYGAYLPKVDDSQ